MYVPYFLQSITLAFTIFEHKSGFTFNDRISGIIKMKCDTLDVNSSGIISKLVVDQLQGFSCVKSYCILTLKLEFYLPFNSQGHIETSLQQSLVRVANTEATTCD